MIYENVCVHMGHNIAVLSYSETHPWLWFEEKESF